MANVADGGASGCLSDVLYDGRKVVPNDLIGGEVPEGLLLGIEGAVIHRVDVPAGVHQPDVVTGGGKDKTERISGRRRVFPVNVLLKVCSILP